MSGIALDGFNVSAADMQFGGCAEMAKAVEDDGRQIELFNQDAELFCNLAFLIGPPGFLCNYEVIVGICFTA